MEGPKILQNETDIPEGVVRIDAVPGALAELFFVEHPTMSKKDPRSKPELEQYLALASVGSVWVYYPWRAVAVRIPEEETYLKLRTARNCNIITPEEQRAYRAATVAVAGLSVGSAALASLVATGGPKRLNIADPDIIEITNLNRIRASLPDVLANKAEVAARNIWELDPFAEVAVYPEGISADGLDAFLSGVNACVDEMDDIGLKFAVRTAAKAHKIPVVMATDNGDGAILDVERFDLEPERPIFHGRVEQPATPLANLSREEFVRLANAIIDPALFTKRQFESVSNIGKTLAGVAQIATAATIAGAVIAYAVRRITTGADMPSGRYLIDPETLLAKPLS